LLALSRKQELRPESIDVFALLDDMRSLLERSLGEQVEVELGEKHAGLYCLADRSQLEGAILNLAINARDAMSDGGTLSIDATWVPVDEVHAAECAELLADGCVAISVRDTGVGIPQNVLDRVFEPFFTTKDIGEGTGLGLSMVYGFAKQSGGHVEIDSADGAGTEVKLYLPSSEALPRMREGDKDTGSHRGDGESVLVLEDEPALRRLVATHLENLGYSVVSVANGEEALSAIESMEAINLLLSDVMLPGGLSGREVATEMKRRRPEAKILLMSGYAKEILTDEDPLGSGDALLNKPFQLNELARKVRGMLDA
jgi:CheY-like chemotaxis protein